MIIAIATTRKRRKAKKERKKAKKESKQRKQAKKESKKRGLDPEVVRDSGGPEQSSGCG